MGIKAYIAGCSGTVLTPAEQQLFSEHEPWGFILFARNIETPDQVRALTGQMRALTGRHDTPILIDQEGGRVRRLRPPHWPDYPPARLSGQLFETDAEAGRRLAWLQSRLIAFDLAALGINVDCLPVLDVPAPGSHDIVGDRAYSSEPAIVADLARSACQGLVEGGVLPVIKHIPGHGRAMADSHEHLPLVDAAPALLGCTDFYPFMQLADMPLAMTAHVVYRAFDDQLPATLSPTIIGEVIRGWFGYDGLLMSDDLSMKALSGDFGERTAKAYGAGCDVVLHCNGDMAEMQAVAQAAHPLGGDAARRATIALSWLARAGSGPEGTLRSEFDDLCAMAAGEVRHSA